jgi:hypothetical protein
MPVNNTEAAMSGKIELPDEIWIAAGDVRDFAHVWSRCVRPAIADAIVLKKLPLAAMKPEEATVEFFERYEWALEHLSDESGEGFAVSLGLLASTAVIGFIKPMMMIEDAIDKASAFNSWSPFQESRRPLHLQTLRSLLALRSDASPLFRLSAAPKEGG